MNNTEHQIAVGIIAGTIVTLILVVFIILIVLKYNKLIRKYEFEKKANEDQISVLQTTIKMLLQDKTKYYDQLQLQVPDHPKRFHIKYYNSFKEVELHLMSERLGIGVITDVGKLNYKVILVDELHHELPEGIGEPDDEEI